MFVSECSDDGAGTALLVDLGPGALQRAAAAGYDLDRLSGERREELLDVCNARGVELTPVFRSSMEAWVESLVDAGMGFSLLPEFSVGARGDRCRPLTDPELVRTICAIRSADRAMTPAMELFWSLLPAE